LKGQAVNLRSADGEEMVKTRLLGQHQADNVVTAVSAAQVLRARGWERLEPAAIAEGIRRCSWPGRLETICLPTGRRVLLDGAHNPAGVAAVCEFLSALGQPVDLLFGALADKEAHLMLPALAHHAERIVLTKPPNPRALEPTALVALLPARRAEVYPDISAALSLALAPSERLLLVCGSLYLVGEVRRQLRERFGVPAPATEPLW
jgi:dihydrofolate synthase/folylpolyglutamate synthase